MNKRKNINLTTKLAAALLHIGDIGYEDSKLMTAKQICSLYEWDHFPIRHENGGPDEPWNLQPRLIKAHREKTAKIDIPGSAKSKRIHNQELVHRYNETAKLDPEAAAGLYPAVARLKARRKAKIPKRVLPWLQGRGFQRKRP